MEVAVVVHNGRGEGYHDPNFASILDNFPAFTSFSARKLGGRVGGLNNATAPTEMKFSHQIGQ